MNERPPSELPQAWLQRAHSDLALGYAALDTPGVLLEDACFHAQQCAEKALKALLLQHQIAFPRTHVLETLLDLLQVNKVAVPADVDEAFALTQYAVQTRYPGDWEIVVREEAKQALATAERVLTWVESQLSGTVKSR